MKDSLKVRLTHKFISPRILAPCNFVARGLAEQLPFVKEENAMVIRTGKKPAPEAPSRLNSPRRIVTASQLNPDKGHADLLDALEILADRGFDFRCEMLGAGSVEAELKSRAGSRNLAGRIHFPGFVQDVRSHMRMADIFVLPSKSEGLPNALLEALAEGLAPVAGDVGGVREAWPPSCEDTLFDRSLGARGLSEALALLLNTPDDEFLALRRTVWEWFRRELSLDVQAEKLESWLFEVAEQSPLS
jgi:glycosyltransferase involved in cell wall biosynthesis